MDAKMVSTSLPFEEETVYGARGPQNKTVKRLIGEGWTVHTVCFDRATSRWVTILRKPKEESQ